MPYHPIQSSIPERFLLDMENLESYAPDRVPLMSQPARYEDLLRQLPVRVEGDIRQPTIAGDIPLWERALLRLKGRPGFGYAELLGRF